MLNNFVIKLALRYFSAKKNNRLVSIISAFSLLGITIGVAALIIVISIMEGFHLELTSKIIGLGGDVTIQPNIGSKITKYQHLKEKISNENFVIKVVPQINIKTLALSSYESTGAIVRAMEVNDIIAIESVSKNLYHGNIEDLKNGFNIAIGNRLADSLNVKVGDLVTIFSPNSVSTLLGNLPRTKKFKVSAIFSSGMYEYDAATILMSLESGQKLFEFSSSVNLIEVHTINPDKSSYFADIIYGIVNKNEILYKNEQEIKKGNIPVSKDKFEKMQLNNNNFYVATWLDHNFQFLNALKIEKVAMFCILSLIVLVAVFNIISSLFMLVNEKTRDIAILKTMGASNMQILMIFIFNGSLIGIIGTSLGAIIGISFSMNIDKIKNFLESISGISLFDAAIYFFSHLPSKIVPEDVISICLMSLVLSIISTIYPAYKASSLDPAEAIRYE